jgi:AraC-like DNA-binding protein
VIESYGFLHTEQQDNLCIIHSIGVQTVTPLSSYDFCGLKRDRSGFLFQYTLSGRGFLEIQGSRIAVPRNSAFLVNIPSEHRYFYDANVDDEPWEFIWLRFSGATAAPTWSQLCAKGHVLQMDPNTRSLQLLWKLFMGAKQQHLDHPVDQSIRVYEWLLTLWDQQVRTEPSVVTMEGHNFDNALRYMRDHLSHPITLQDIAGTEQLSKHHFCKAFHKRMGASPIAYLNKIRVEEAANLLTGTRYTVTEIAKLTGFENPGYFTKVFKKTIGLTPTEYRNGTREPLVSVLRIL